MIHRYVHKTQLTSFGECRIYVRYNSEKDTYSVSILKTNPANRARPLFKTQYKYSERFQPWIRNDDFNKTHSRVMHNVVHEAVLDFFIESSDKPLKSIWPTFQE